MRTFLLSLTALTVLTAAVVVAASAQPANGQGPSPGCEAVNDPKFDGLFIAAGVGAFPFAAGERITATAGPPSVGTPIELQISLAIDGTVVDTAAFPGTVTYTFPASTTSTNAGWTVDGSTEVTWTVSCWALGDVGQAASGLRDVVAGLGIHHGIANALDSKLRRAHDALAIGDNAGACRALRAFLNQVSAQSGKKLTEEQAADLGVAAGDIRDQLGC